MKDTELNDIWFLLYGGSSPDGCGPGKYVGRTKDISIAVKHAKEVESSPYNTGKVEVVTDKYIDCLDSTELMALSSVSKSR